MGICFHTVTSYNKFNVFSVSCLFVKKIPLRFSKSTLDYSAVVSVESASAVGNNFAFTSSVISASNSG